VFSRVVALARRSVPFACLYHSLYMYVKDICNILNLKLILSRSFIGRFFSEKVKCMKLRANIIPQKEHLESG
jgi:hypothetical protein